jgi:predicted HTH transcriptional regulator
LGSFSILCAMPTPFEIFENPDSYLQFLSATSDDEFEHQHLDRKEAGRNVSGGTVTQSQLANVREEIRDCVSAFANSNRDGGLVVLGISSDGKIKGINHLSETQRNSLVNIDNLLKNQSAGVKLIDCYDETQNANRICLIYVPYSTHAICETPSSFPKAWIRQGCQNLPINDQQRDQLRREKQIIDFERQPCCPFDPSELDHDVVSEFRKAFLAEADFTYSDEELLFQAGALIRDGGGYQNTNAGVLFFAANPQRVLPWAAIRVLRYEATMSQESDVGLVSLDKSFTGPLSKQIRQIRSYIQSSGFFKTYQIRNPDGGFREEPELPLIAVDEAIVNAVVHRDYAMRLPVECRKYTDAFIVGNPGRIIQRDHDVPNQFSLAEVTLDHIPPNAKLLEWLKIMRDERGAAFVGALSEGTKRMKTEMEKLNLPAPSYNISTSQTKVVLYSNAVERERQIRAASTTAASAEFINLFPLQFNGITDQLAHLRLSTRRSEILIALENALESHNWFVDSAKHGRIIAHKRGIEIPVPSEVSRFLRLYPAYSFQIREYWDQCYLSIDYTLSVKNVRNVVELLNYFGPVDLTGLSTTAYWNKWHRGRILRCSPEWTTVFLYGFNSPQEIPSNKVIPSLPRRLMDRMLSELTKPFDIGRAIKQASLSLEPGASRVRAAKSLTIALNIAQTVFPIKLNDGSVFLQPTPAPVLRDQNIKNALIAYSLPEPNVEFNHRHETPDIRDGITKFGSYDQFQRKIELIPLCSEDLRSLMASLIERLKVGKYKYRGAERTFSARFTYRSVVTSTSDGVLWEEAQRLLTEHPEWCGDKTLDRIFLVCTPEASYSLDDEKSPYYRIKRLLLENGIPCQMVDRPTLANPDYKDLNLALNIIAKCGITPWVLPDAIPDADFFIGLSYTQHRDRIVDRLMGYANVFNQYGRWMFYSGNTEAFPYEERVSRFESLVEETLKKLTLSETPSIYFHYSARFSRDDIAAILRAARRVRPNGTYSFVWINTSHQVRFYDRTPEGDGSMRRGTFVVGGPRQIYLSTTGDNPYRKSMGTPQVLELNIRMERGDGLMASSPDLKALAVQVLCLTKLNWASTDSLTGEPITTKYAGDIAYLTAAFLRQRDEFKLHPVLERTPWFL